MAKAVKKLGRPSVFTPEIGDEICVRYDLSPEEYYSWQRKVTTSGAKALTLREIEAARHAN